MRDRTVILIAVLTALGAWFVVPVPRPVALVLAGGVVVTRSPVLLAAACVAWASGSGAVALDALRHGPTSGTYVGTVTLVGDPVPLTYGARVDVRIDGRRFEASVDRELADVVLDHLTGERVEVRGTFGARPADAPWLDARHIAGRFRITEVGAWHPPAAPYAVANTLRRTLARGAASLPSERRALYTGLVYGDDRGQPALLADDFRAGGLGHLLAVSGQNVAFALAAAAPLLRRVPLRARWPATLVVLGLFVLVTRAEPSVLRAAAMAAIAARAATLGRTAAGVRVLALAVTALLCVDPLLVRAVGFQLSVAASLGILVGSRPLAARLWGPAALREAAAVTLAAQLAVAPISVLVFGGVPLASIPANLLALPAAGVVMVWGLTGGLVAGVLGAPFADVLQLPTRVLLWWIELVAGYASRTRFGVLRGPHVAVLVGATASWAWASRRARRAGPLVHRAAAVAGAVALVAAVVAVRDPPPVASEVASGVWLWRNGAVAVEIDSAARSASALEVLRDLGVSSIDVLVVRRATSPAAVVARDLIARYAPPVVWAPVRHQVRGARSPVPGEQVVVGGLVVVAEESADQLRVTVTAA